MAVSEESSRAGEERSLPGGALVAFAVRENAEDAMIASAQTMAERKARRQRQAMAERAAGGVDRRDRLAEADMPPERRAVLQIGVEQLRRDEAILLEGRVIGHGRMALGENDAVALRRARGRRTQIGNSQYRIEDLDDAERGAEMR